MVFHWLQALGGLLLLGQRRSFFLLGSVNCGEWYLHETPLLQCFPTPILNEFSFIHFHTFLKKWAISRVMFKNSTLPGI